MAEATSLPESLSGRPDRAPSLSPLRMLELVLVFSYHLLGAALDRLRGQTAPLPRRLRLAFERLGPTFIKLGQLIASSPGIFPRSLSDEFLACLDQLPALPEPTVQGILEQELGGRLGRFRRIEPRPVAAASMAQVHFGELEDGRRVALKILRPGIDRILVRDIGNMLLVARILDRLHHAFHLANLIGVVEDFAKTLEEELDLELEAATMTRYREILLEGFEFQIDVPEPIPDLSTARVLVMERVEGIRADQRDRIRAAGIDARECLTRLMRATMRGMMFHGIFHGDLHAGNLRLAEGDRVVLMDFGLMGRVDEAQSRHLTHLFLALARRNFEAMASALLALEQLPPERAEAFARDLETTLRPVIRSSVGEMDFGWILQSLVAMGGRHGVRLPRALILLLKQLLYVDRFAHLLAPEYNPFKDPRTIDFLWHEERGRLLYPELLESLARDHLQGMRDAADAPDAG